MKRLLLVFTVLLGASGAASGQNLSGAYVGASIGQSWATGELRFLPPINSVSDAAPDGWVGMLNAGINWQSGSTVFGVEIDGGSGPLSNTTNCENDLLTCKTDVRWLSTLRGRLGIVNQTALVYATAGGAAGGVRLTQTDNLGLNLSSSTSKTQVGWSAGVGIASPASRGWAWKAEWLHIDLGEADYGTFTKFKYKTDILRAGFDYRF